MPRASSMNDISKLGIGVSAAIGLIVGVGAGSMKVGRYEQRLDDIASWRDRHETESRSFQVATESQLREHREQFIRLDLRNEELGRAVNRIAAVLEQGTSVPPQPAASLPRVPISQSNP